MLLRNSGMYSTSYVTGFAGPLKSLNTLNSIHNNQKIVRDKRVCLLISEMRPNCIARNTHVYFVLTKVRNLDSSLQMDVGGFEGSLRN